MKLFAFFVLPALFVGSLAHAGTCADAASELMNTYPNTPEFKAAFVSAIETLTPYKVKRVKFNEPSYPGDSHAGLDRDLIPPGLTLLGDDGDSILYDSNYNNLDIGTNSDGRNSLELTFTDRTAKPQAYFRIDNWVICDNDKVVQPYVKVQGSVTVGDNYYDISFIWDMQKKIAIVPVGTSPLIRCEMQTDSENAGPFIWSTMTIRQAKEHGKYFAEFDLNESGSFTLTDCELTSQMSLACGGESLYSASLSWMGLVTGKPDKMEMEILAKGANGSPQVMLPKQTFKCQ